ncbi:MAG: hypothetical protein MR274_01275 [Clostridium sp.]|nr:hypothetical protein [Clostridium sp.]MDY3827862.1 hypothetical protein [Clostridium sp.]
MYRLFIVLLMLLPFSLVSCSSEESVSKEPVGEVQFTDIQILKKGAVKANINGKYKNINFLAGEYKESESVDTVASYDYNSGSYIGESDGKYVACFHNQRFVLDNVLQVGDYNFKVSPGGENVLFFRNTSEGKRVQVYSLKDKDSINIINKAVISGEYVKWYDGNSFIFYGVNQEEEKNGIFLYDLQSGSEQCLIPIKEGIVEFLQRIDDEIIYCISTDMGKSLISFNINTKEKIILSDSIFNIYDIVKIDKDYYFLGQLVTADDSLYRISNGQINRLVYGFPKKVIVKKEIMLSEENEILFIGKDEDEYVEKVYKSTKDGEISIVKEFNYEVTFVK